MLSVVVLHLLWLSYLKLGEDDINTNNVIFLSGNVSDWGQKVARTESQTREVRSASPSQLLHVGRTCVCNTKSKPTDDQEKESSVCNLQVEGYILYFTVLLAVGCFMQKTENLLIVLTLCCFASREKELAKVTIKKEDVELIVSSFYLI